MKFDEDENDNVKGQLSVDECVVDNEATAVTASVDGVASSSGEVEVSDVVTSASKADRDVGAVKASADAKDIVVTEVVVKASGVADKDSDKDEDAA